MKTATARQQKLAAAYDADIWPLVPERAGEAILRRLPRLSGARVLDVGAATGKLTLNIASRLDSASQILGVDSSPALIELAEAAKGPHPAGGKTSFQVMDLPPAGVPDAGAFDLVLSNLALAEAPEPQNAIAAVAHALKPGGRIVLTLPLRGSWGAFIDLYADVLIEQGRKTALAALRTYEASLPDADTAVRWLESAGFEGVTVDVDRWELLFKSAREFFFAPIVEMGPLAQWKQVAGGRGDEMQDVFFFVKEAIETYFSGGVFPVSMVIGCLQGAQRRAGAPVGRAA